jgi:hypothetical protein
MNTGLELFAVTNSDFQSPLSFARDRAFRVYEGGRLFMISQGMNRWMATCLRNGLHRR